MEKTPWVWNLKIVRGYTAIQTLLSLAVCRCPAPAGEADHLGGLLTVLGCGHRSPRRMLQRQRKETELRAVILGAPSLWGWIRLGISRSKVIAPFSDFLLGRILVTTFSLSLWGSWMVFTVTNSPISCDGPFANKLSSIFIYEIFFLLGQS